MANKLRVYWPGDQLCHSCFYTAMRTHGICPACGHDGVLPGRRNRTDPRPVCLTCAGIPGDFTCRTCSGEGEIYRCGQCARCALREDLCKILLHHPADLAAMQTLIEVLCGVDRPESILTWKRNIQVLELLGGITSGAIPLTGLPVRHLALSPNDFHLPPPVTAQISPRFTPRPRYRDRLSELLVVAAVFDLRDERRLTLSLGRKRS